MLIKRFLVVLAIVLATVLAAVVLRREVPNSGKVYSVQQVEALLARGPGTLAGQTIRVRALRLGNCPAMQGGTTHVWYICDLIPASLAPRLHAPGTVTLPTPLDLWADPPGGLALFLHRLPLVGGLVPLKTWDNDFEPKVYHVRLTPSPTCYTADPTAPCPRAQYLGPE